MRRRFLEPVAWAEPRTTGTTFAQYANGPDGRPLRLPYGLPYFKPSYSTITAYDANTGEIAFQIPTDETLDRIRNNPALDGIDKRTGEEIGRIEVPA